MIFAHYMAFRIRYYIHLKKKLYYKLLPQTNYNKYSTRAHLIITTHTRQTYQRSWTTQEQGRMFRLEMVRFSSVRFGQVFLRTENRTIGSVQRLCRTPNRTIGSVQNGLVLVLMASEPEPDPFFLFFSFFSFSEPEFISSYIFSVLQAKY